MVALLIIVSSTGSGGGDAYQVTLAWDANPEPDIAGYRLHYGTESGVYPNTVDVGNITLFDLPIQEPGTYYTVVTAYNTSGLESLPSNEIYFSLPRPYGIELWREIEFGPSVGEDIAMDMSDPDNDGITNLEEYAMNLKPLSSDTLPISLEKVGSTMNVGIDHRESMAGILILLEASGDLESWETLATLYGGWTIHKEGVHMGESGATSTIIVPEQGTHQFYRITVQRP